MTSTLVALMMLISANRCIESAERCAETLKSVWASRPFSLWPVGIAAAPFWRGSFKGERAANAESGIRANGPVLMRFWPIASA